MKLPAILRYLAILTAVSSGGTWADDCKPIVAALAKQANTSFRVMLGATTTKGVTTEHFYATLEGDAAGKQLSEFWISPETGLVRRREDRLNKTTIIEYDYNNLDSIF
ncbi:hypothetical protein [Bradyrhizobium sp. 21]|uniref:hypothetical protein n=1 Tax=Bradyrhizobium sp. 21 TaxID=2782666 RepID=UPI001FFB0473|nr:hypothetical protein [Bradyrhizobium sp. 21]MCK1388920.1 hypothetical protein [Bradyrhizobium sp. 21]